MLNRVLYSPWKINKTIPEEPESSNNQQKNYDYKRNYTILSDNKPITTAYASTKDEVASTSTFTQQRDNFKRRQNHRNSYEQVIKQNLR